VTIFVCIAGKFSIAIKRSYSPLGVDRFYNLCTCGYFNTATEADNNAGFFR
jgi:cyclophilin family peptidyl-prolyl cis-trans isomerase